MFYKVEVLDAKGKLKKIFTTEMLSKRHWDMFPDNIKKTEKEKKEKAKKIILTRLRKKTTAPQEAKKICGYEFKIGGVYSEIIIKIDGGISISIYIWLVVCRIQLFRRDLFKNQDITKTRRC